MEEPVQEPVSPEIEQWRAAIGEAAHELNNILGTIVAVTSMLASEPDLPDEHREGVELALEACNRGQRLGQAMLRLARGHESPGPIIPLNAPIPAVGEADHRPAPLTVSS